MNWGLTRETTFRCPSTCLHFSLVSSDYIRFVNYRYNSEVHVPRDEGFACERVCVCARFGLRECVCVQFMELIGQ